MTQRWRFPRAQSCNLGYARLIYFELINSKCYFDKSLGDCSNLCIQGSLLDDNKSVFPRHKNH